ncbi:MAG: hypothetical protein IPN53_18775 [Comamonadaceae bacterium]|nr:hypothetical protein [Comamonadaceae bacterium]
MDESAYHGARQLINPTPCVLERAILAGYANCELSRRKALAEREVITCSSQVARINCSTLQSLFVERAKFALRLPRQGAPLAYAKAMKLQCGGLRGLQTALAAPELNVHAMVQEAMHDQASLLDLPWDAIVASIAAWQLRKRATSP